MLKKLLLSLLFVFTVTNANGATEPTCESVTKLYIATFNRAPDSAGLCYWVNSGFSIEEIAESFFDQPETQALYPSGLNDVDFINTIYNNVLCGRDADPDGLYYWLNELEDGSTSRSLLILAIINGALGDDAVCLHNKTIVGLAFACDGRNDIKEARDIIRGVTSNPQSVIDALLNYTLPACPRPNIGCECCECSGCAVAHNGTDYCLVTSPYTGKVWLDRNLGAAQACKSFDDEACYGDYYQWGRNFDGHQDSASSTITKQAEVVDPVGHGDFIRGSSDWASVDGGGATRSDNWSMVDGSSVCPTGYRVPTMDELSTETTDVGVIDRNTAFSNFLKLPSSGHRDYSSGSMGAVGLWGSVWTSSASHHMGFTSDYISWNYVNRRAYGLSVRCLKD